MLVEIACEACKGNNRVDPNRLSAARCGHCGASLKGRTVEATYDDDSDETEPLNLYLIIFLAGILREIPSGAAGRKLIAEMADELSEDLSQCPEGVVVSELFGDHNIVDVLIWLPHKPPVGQINFCDVFVRAISDFVDGETTIMTLPEPAQSDSKLGPETQRMLDVFVKKAVVRELKPVLAPINPDSAAGVILYAMERDLAGWNILTNKLLDPEGN